MKNVSVRGPLLSKSGYGTHSRQIVKWLVDRETRFFSDLTPWGITPWHINGDDVGGLIGTIMNSTANRSDNYDVSIQIQLPHEWTPGLGKLNVGVTAGVEADRAPAAWVEAIHKMDVVVVPSRFTKETLVKSGANPEKLIVIPESYNPMIDLDTCEVDLSSIKTKFNFLMFGQITGNDPNMDRKNIFYTVKWFCEEFKNNKDVGLIIKSNMGTNCIFHRKSLNDLFKKLVSEVRQGDFPRVYLLNGDMSDTECAGLFRNPKVNCLVSLTKGEGYGLPMVDAAASGLPVIATDWSGHLDFLGRGKFSRVAYELTNVPQAMCDGRIFVPGSRWAMPKEDDAKKRMRKMYESQAVPRTWASELQPIIRNEFSQAAVSKLYEELIGGHL